MCQALIIKLIGLTIAIPTNVLPHLANYYPLLNLDLILTLWKSYLTLFHLVRFRYLNFYFKSTLFLINVYMLYVLMGFGMIFQNVCRVCTKKIQPPFIHPPQPTPGPFPISNDHHSSCRSGFLAYIYMRENVILVFMAYFC